MKFDLEVNLLNKVIVVVKDFSFEVKRDWELYLYRKIEPTFLVIKFHVKSKLPCTIRVLY